MKRRSRSFSALSQVSIAGIKVETLESHTLANRARVASLTEPIRRFTGFVSDGPAVFVWGKEVVFCVERGKAVAQHDRIWYNDFEKETLKKRNSMAMIRIAENGASPFHIVTHRYADETVRFAASELQKYLLMATGADLPYFSDRCPMRGPEIRVGPKVRDMADSDLPPEGYRIREDGWHIYIEGGDSRGVLYGVYDFLTRFCGFRCFTKDTETIAHTDILEVEIDDIRGNPAFEYREAYFRRAFDGDFCAKNHLNSNMGDISKARGGRMKWFNFHHSFRDLVPAEEYFDAHPEYFSEIEGKRVPDRRSISH